MVTLESNQILSMIKVLKAPQNLQKNKMMSNCWSWKLMLADLLLYSIQIFRMAI